MQQQGRFKGGSQDEGHGTDLVTAWTLRLIGQQHGHFKDGGPDGEHTGEKLVKQEKARRLQMLGRGKGAMKLQGYNKQERASSGQEGCKCWEEAREQYNCKDTIRRCVGQIPGASSGQGGCKC
eukprot:1154236-Pelagomonas_calceolata.AAC.8